MSSAVVTEKTVDSSAPRTMTGGEAAVETLKRNGVDTVFGLPGVQLDGLFNAFYENKDSIRVIHTRHEQATAYMADGYARVTGKEGVCVVVPGPGVMNASAALATAYACNSSVLCLTGQIRSDMIGVGVGLLHEIPDQLGMARSFSKFQKRANTPAEVPAALEQAIAATRTGRPRPTYVEVPPDIFFASGEVEIGSAVGKRSRSGGDPDLIARAAEALSSARNPLIYAGGGVLLANAGEELIELARMIQAPIIVSRNGKGVIDDRDDLSVGQLADKDLRPEADVILVVGTRFLGPTSEPLATRADQTVIRIDIDPEEIVRNGRWTIEIEADARAALAALVDAVSPDRALDAEKLTALRAMKARLQAQVESIEPQASYARAIRQTLPDEGILVGEMTQIGYWSNLGYPVYKPNTYLGCGYQGTLGFGFTLAMGAKVGKPDVPVVSVNGDGGFGFTLNELSTLVQHNIGLITIVFNDNAYGNVKRIQQVDMGGRQIASDLVNPDYVKLAEAFGVTGRRAETPDQLAQQLADSIRADEPTLIEVPVSQMPDPWKTLKLR
ncbi:MAG: thiamine pyrophosphate-binding protein [Thermomicrobiales bacterium]|nr:thiamine pyrophosphate-binding protein [Thermomicrobiales bacterium]